MITHNPPSGTDAVLSEHETPVTPEVEKNYPLVCVDCRVFFQDREITEDVYDARTKNKTKVTRLQTASEQAYNHGQGFDTMAHKNPSFGVSPAPRQHSVFQVSKAAWDRGEYAEWFARQPRRENK